MTKYKNKNKKHEQEPKPKPRTRRTRPDNNMQISYFRCHFRSARSQIALLYYTHYTLIYCLSAKVSSASVFVQTTFSSFKALCRPTTHRISQTPRGEAGESCWLRMNDCCTGKPLGTGRVGVAVGCGWGEGDIRKLQDRLLAGRVFRQGPNKISVLV